jgi:hypothetical protein
MAVRDDFTAGEVLAAADLNDTFASKLDLAGGKILQIVRATDSTDRSTTSTVLVDVTGMSVTITPEKSDSAIIIIATAKVESSRITTSGANARGYVYITDGDNNLISGSHTVGVEDFPTLSVGAKILGHISAFGYSTPATTSAVTYKLRFAVSASNQQFTLLNGSPSLQTGQMFAIEVSA